MNFKKITTVALATGLIFSATGANAKLPNPKVGQCYNYTVADVALSNPPNKQPVSCSKTHTDEVYKVVTLSNSKSPYKMSSEAFFNFAQTTCLAGFPAYSFNYWGYYTPTKSQWNSGQHWLRCDAFQATSISGNSPKGLKSWRGKHLR